MGIAERLQIIIAATDQTSSAARAVQRNIAMINAEIGMMKAGLMGFGALIPIAALQAVYEHTRRAVGAVDDLGDAAQRLGVSTDFIQAFGYQLQQFGGDAKDAEGALDQFSKRIGEAAKGSGELYGWLKANGVALKNANGEMRSNEDLLQDVSRLVGNLGSAQEKAALATDAFGKNAGPKMVTFLEQVNKVGFKALTQDAINAGVVIEKDLFGPAGDPETKFITLEKVMDKALKVLAVEAGPAAVEVLQTWLG